MSDFQNVYKIKYMNNLLINDKNMSKHISEINKLTDVSFLILNGNIGNPFDDVYKDFLRVCCEKKFKFVILVIGNYEYSCYDNYSYVNNHVRNIVNNLYSQYSNIVFLENGTLFYLDRVFIGSSLYKNEDYVKNVEYIKGKIGESLKKYSTPLIITHNPVEEDLFYKKLDKNSNHENNILYF